ncbi:protein FAR-RED IMPAIRED RESPONSE 1-like [Olea europaea var. sylvestris]|uniref:protein FAR-RED IMPAIRED RESPONSE 1-like n=1 Tax=Olea europaea var. sylvestris TaxID=158386 RepID=UPI000C1D8689|nr:protein FAR-RED IMPAIRED RESPONSE 1-like [Olea europaea var. sylvestris]
MTYGIERKEIMEDENQDVLADCDSENIQHNLNILDNENVAGDVASEPEVGMTFNDEKEMLEFYKRYAYAVGFPVRKRNSKKGDDGVMRYVTFTCSREGRKNYATGGSLKPQPTSQTDCKARISASLDNLGVWRINKVYLDYNHKTSPSKSRLYRCNRILSASVKRKLQVNDMAGIPLHKSYNSAVVEASGYENTTFVERDCRNYVDQERRLRLGEEDVIALQAYFSKMQARCSGFFF